MCWVRQLAVLAERFQQNICAMDVDWNKNLLSGSTLLRQISCEDLGMLADGIKEEDLTNFRDLRRDDFSQVESTYLRGLGVRWQTLSEIARACAVVDSDVAERIGKVVKVRHPWISIGYQADLVTAVALLARLPIHDSFAHWAPSRKRLSSQRLGPLRTHRFGQQLCQLPSALGEEARHSISVSSCQGAKTNRRYRHQAR